MVTQMFDIFIIIFAVTEILGGNTIVVVKIVNSSTLIFAVTEILGQNAIVVVKIVNSSTLIFAVTGKMQLLW